VNWLENFWVYMMVVLFGPERRNIDLVFKFLVGQLDGYWKSF
jgi:hypothetical protein